METQQTDKIRPNIIIQAPNLSSSPKAASKLSEALNKLRQVYLILFIIKNN